MKECGILGGGVKTYSDLLNIFRGQELKTASHPRIYALGVLAASGVKLSHAALVEAHRYSFSIRDVKSCCQRNRVELLFCLIFLLNDLDFLNI